MKILVTIGGGDLRSGDTYEIDREIVRLSGTLNGVRKYAFFWPTASHDSKPYFNTLRKMYTSRLGCKSDVALITTGEMDVDKIRAKIDKADIIYLGGGDTAYMMEQFGRYGIVDMLRDAYDRGCVICGLSAGAICWYEHMQSDRDKMNLSKDAPYVVLDGYGWVEGICYPHFDDLSRRRGYEDIHRDYERNIAIEGRSAVVYVDGEMRGSISAGGESYLNGEIIPPLDI